MISHETRKIIERSKNDARHLKLTRETVATWREHRGRGPEFDKELFKLVQEMARYEWGEDTTVDDFSDEKFIIVRNGQKEMRL